MRIKVPIRILRKNLSYDPISGEIQRIKPAGRWGCIPIGTIAGCPNGSGYKVFYLAGHLLLAHRVAWALATGAWPKKEIDHIDGNPSNNARDNLREATRVQNGSNKKLSKINTSGFKGVSTDGRPHNPWRAGIKVRGKTINLGNFHTREEAAAAYRRGADKYHGEFARFS